MLPSFSSLEKVQVEYSIRPPGFKSSAAWRRISRCILANTSGPCFSQAGIMWACFRNMPSPEQGASMRILSKYSWKYRSSRSPISLVTRRLGMPNTSRFFSRALVLEALASLAIKNPV